MKRGLRKWWINLKWRNRNLSSRQDEIDAFRGAVRTLEKDFNVKIIHTIDEVVIKDLNEKHWTIYSYERGYKI